MVRRHWKPLRSLILCFAGPLALSACAGNEQARLLLADITETAPKVRADIEKFKERDAGLVELAQNLGQVGVVQLESGDNTCERLGSEAALKLARSQNVIALEIVRAASDVAAQIEPTIEAAAKSLDDRDGELIDDFRDSSGRPPHERQAKLALVLAYRLKVLDATLRVLEEKQQAIIAETKKQIEDLANVSANKRQAIESAVEKCKGESARAASGTVDLADLEPASEAYALLSRYVETVGKGSEVLTKQRTLSRRAFEQFFRRTGQGIVDGALELDGAQGLNLAETLQSAKDVAKDIGDNGKALKEIQETLSVGNLKRAAGLSDITGRLKTLAIDNISGLIDDAITRIDPEAKAEAAKAISATPNNGDN